MPELMTLIRAKEILRGTTNAGLADVLAAGQRISTELTRLYRIEIWADRLLHATDDTASERARHGLAKALLDYPTGQPVADLQHDTHPETGSQQVTVTS